MPRPKTYRPIYIPQGRCSCCGKPSSIYLCEACLPPAKPPEPMPVLAYRRNGHPVPKAADRS